MKIYLKVKPEAHEKTKMALEKEVKLLEKANSGVKGWILRKMTMRGTQPLIFHYKELGIGEFEINAMSVIGDMGFFKAIKKELTKDLKTDLIEIAEVKKP